MAYTKYRTMTSIIGLLGFMTIGQAPAFAQAGEEIENEPIIVTAQRREEASVDVPVTVNTLGAAAIETANVASLPDIVKLTPGLRFDFASSYVQPTIRGVGTAVVSSGAVGNVGIYIDGFYSPNPSASDMQLLNVRNIQVLKGPQGTLFGRNTTGGAILVQTADPSTEAGGQAKVSYGRYNQVKAQGYYTFGLSDKIAMDVEGVYSRGDGWLTNISTGKKVGDYENWSARVGLKADLSDSVSVMLRYYHRDLNDPRGVLPASYTESKASNSLLPFVITNGAPFYAVPGQYTFRHNEVALGSHPNDQQYLHSKSNVFQATIQADLGFANLTSYTQYRRENQDMRIDGDYSGVEYYDLHLPNYNRTITQEFLLTSLPGNPLQWTAGLFYVRNKDSYYPLHFDFFPALGVFDRCCDFGSSSVSQSYAAFLDATYEITPRLFVTGGVRYAHDKQSKAFTLSGNAAIARDLFGAPAAPFNRPSAADYNAVNGDQVTPRVVIRYKPTEESSVYASYSKGYKAAFLDLGSGTPLPVKPEKIDAYEVGFKYDNRKLSFESAFFYYDYRNLQISLYDGFAAIIANAASSKVYGIDGQLRYSLSDSFSVNLGGTWLHARYKRFDLAPIYTPCLTLPDAFDPGGCADFLGGAVESFPIVPTELRNVTMQRSPEFTGNLGATYKTELGGGELQLSGNLYYSSKFFFGPSGIQFPQKAYEVLSLRAQWTDPSGRFKVALWGDNVTNSRYKTAVQYGPTAIGSNWSQPVTYGVELGVNF